VVAGGEEKVSPGDWDQLGDLEVVSDDEADPRDLLLQAIGRLEPEAVLDLSDEPVLDYRRRHEMVAVALFAGVPYEGSDFTFRPPERPRLATSPSLAIIGTGKRTGKTAITGFAARQLREEGRTPVVVAMGRGGPEEPDVIRGGEIDLTPEDLLELADSGKHAASDYIEDALLGRVTTVGCRRCGGGLAGAVGVSNVGDGVIKANEEDGDFLLLEGSGSALPPVHADATGLIVPSSVPAEYLLGYLGPFRLLLADFVMVTMCENPFGTPSQISATVSHIRSAWRPTRGKQEPADEIQVVRTVFRPHPVRSIEGASVFVATTAPEAAAESLKRHLEEEHGCEVKGISHSLSKRTKLKGELNDARGGADVLLCEIKAAGIDVATRWALDEGLEVVYMDNVPVGVDGDDPSTAITKAAQLATERYDHE
jgi:cyclic 2,3-diphosphoglycerate synthase